MEPKKILSIKDLVVKFRVRSRVLTSIRNVSFDIYDGETVAIVGESGSGKSVLTKTLTNMLESNGYIANGSIDYYPSEAAIIDPLSVFKNPIDLIGFHQNSMQLDSRHDIVKYNRYRIKEAKKEIRRLNHFKAGKPVSYFIFFPNDWRNYPLPQAIKILEAKLKVLNKPEIAFSMRAAKKRDRIRSTLNRLKAVKKLVDHPRLFEKEIEHQNRIILSANQEIANFKLLHWWQKIHYQTVVDFVNRNYAKPHFNRTTLNRHRRYFQKILYKNSFETELANVLKAMSLPRRVISKEQLQALNSHWAYVKRPNFVIRRRAVKDLQHLRGGTIATVFQDPMTSLNPLLSVGYQISEVVRLHQKLGYRESKQEAIKLMNKVGIPDAAKRYNDLPSKYSGGMRQRIVIAIALASKPQILILDEPTTALDVTIQAQILELIKKLKEEYKFTVIFITHDLGVVANVADRVAVVYAGQIVEYGKTEEIFNNPKHPYTWALLSSLPQLGTKGENLYSIPGTPPSLFNKIKGDAFAPRNEYAMAIDYEHEPPFFQVSPTHAAKTWLLDPRAPRVKRPKQLANLQQAVQETQVVEEQNYE